MQHLAVDSPTQALLTSLDDTFAHQLETEDSTTIFDNDTQLCAGRAKYTTGHLARRTCKVDHFDSISWGFKHTSSPSFVYDVYLSTVSSLTMVAFNNTTIYGILAIVAIVAIAAPTEFDFRCQIDC